MSDDFQIAFERARKRIGQRLWAAMSSRAQTIEIYVELRALDAERAARRAAEEPPTSDGDGSSR